MVVGPAYVADMPTKESVVCDPHSSKTTARASSLWSRYHVPVKRLVLTGVVREAGTCKPIPNARIEFWQPSSAGRYSMTNDGFCQGALMVGHDGIFNITTEEPGTYGLLGGLGP